MLPESTGRTSNLTKGDREMIVTTTSAANQCLYCVVAHGALLRIYEKKPLVADQVAVNYKKADVSQRQRAMLDFAMKVCTSSHAIDELQSQHHPARVKPGKPSSQSPAWRAGAA